MPWPSLPKQDEQRIRVYKQALNRNGDIHL